MGCGSSRDEVMLDACKTGDLRSAAAVLKMGFKPNTPMNSLGDTPLLLAVRFGRLELALLLLQSGAKAGKANKDGVTALHEAAKRSYAGGVQVLVRGIQSKQLQGALNAKDALGRTPLHYAAASDRGEAIAALAKAGADLKSCTSAQRTPLHAAAYVGAAKAVEALLAAGAPHSAKDDAGDTPLHDAASRGFKECVHALVAAGADPTATNHKGQVTMSLAPPGELRAWMGAPLCTAAMTGDAKHVRALLKGGVDPNAADASGATALHCAARINSVGVAKALLKHGAFVDLPDKMRNTPLHYAAGFGAMEVAEVLMAAGACTGVKNARGLLPRQVVPVPPPSAEALKVAATEKAEAEAAAKALKAAMRAKALAAAAAAQQAAEQAAAAPSEYAPSAAASVSDAVAREPDAEAVQSAQVLGWLRLRAELEDGPNEGAASALVADLNPLERRMFLADARKRGAEAAADDLFARHGVLQTEAAPPPAATAAAVAQDPLGYAWDYTWGEGRGDTGANERMAAIERRILAQAATGRDLGGEEYSSSEDEFEHGRAFEPVSYATGFALAESFDDDASGSWSLPPSSRPPSPPKPRIRRRQQRPPSESEYSEEQPEEPELPPVPEKLPSDMLARYDVMMARADARRAGKTPSLGAEEIARRVAADKLRQVREEQRQQREAAGKPQLYRYDSAGSLRV